MPELDLGPPDLTEQIKEVEREIAMRKSAYPRWVSAGKMTQAAADRQIRNMEAVLATLFGLAP